MAYKTSPRTISGGLSPTDTGLHVKRLHPHTSQYLSVQLFNQGDVSKTGVNRKDASSAGVKADVVGDRFALGVCPVQRVHVRACKGTGGLESGTQLFSAVAVAQNKDPCLYSECAIPAKAQPEWNLEGGWRVRGARCSGQAGGVAWAAKSQARSAPGPALCSPSAQAAQPRREDSGLSSPLCVAQAGKCSWAILKPKDLRL